jgi:RNA polymerase sigma factor (TIGR02999 family)
MPFNWSVHTTCWRTAGLGGGGGALRSVLKRQSDNLAVNLSAVLRRILVDHARHSAAVRHGGGRHDAHRLTESPEGLLDLDDALTRFAATEPTKAKLVELRFFGGLTVPEAAAALGVSPATAARWWEFARLWLYAELTGEENSAHR